LTWPPDWAITDPPKRATAVGRSLLTAGVDTTVHALGVVLYGFAAHPTQWRRLRQRPELARTASTGLSGWSPQGRRSSVPPRRHLNNTLRTLADLRVRLRLGWPTSGRVFTGEKVSADHHAQCLQEGLLAGGTLLITQIMPIQPVISHSAISAETETKIYETRPTRHALDAGLGLYAPGGNRVGQCRVVAFGLIGVGLAEVGHGLVELV
jgi:hypothetical protein